MAIVACSECGKEVSTEAAACPHRGAPSANSVKEQRTKKNAEVFSALVTLAVTGAAFYYLWPLFSPFLIDIGIISPSRPHVSVAAPKPMVPDDLATIISATGCSSSYSDDKKQDVFDRQYKDHLVRATGEVVRLDKSSLGLRVLSSSISQDAEVQLRNPEAGYDLRKNARVTVVFRLQRLGGCFLPYGGDLGEITTAR